MGYHLRIIRTDNGCSLPIDYAEFASAVSAIPSLALDSDQTTARYVTNDELRSTISLTDGEVWTNNAEDDVLAVMLELAKLLKGRVRGDEGETYRSVNDSYIHPDDASLAEVQESESKHHRQWLWNAVRITVVLAVLILILVNFLRK